MKNTIKNIKGFIKKTPMRFVFYYLFFLFGILFNGVDFIIRYSILMVFQDSKTAQVLETIRDSAFLGSALLFIIVMPRFEYRRSINISLLMMACGGIAILLPDHFWSAMIFFFLAGISFGVIYTIGYQTAIVSSDNKKRFATTVMAMEAVFLLGYFFANILLNTMVEYTLEWHYALIVIIPLTLIGIAFNSLVMPQSQIIKSENKFPIRDILFRIREMINNSLAVMFILCVFLLVFANKLFFHWIHIYDVKILKSVIIEKIDLKTVELIQVVLIFMAMGLFIIGVIIRKIKSFYIYGGSIGLLIVLVFVSEYNMLGAQELHIKELETFSLLYLPVPFSGFMLAYLLPIAFIGFINRIVPSGRRAGLLAYIVIFTLAKYTATIVSDYFFKNFTPHVAYTFIILPLAVSLVLFYLFYFGLKHSENEENLSF